jgi:hypothetical protein
MGGGAQELRRSGCRLCPHRLDHEASAWLGVSRYQGQGDCLLGVGHDWSIGQNWIASGCFRRTLWFAQQLRQLGDARREITANKSVHPTRPGLGLVGANGQW